MKVDKASVWGVLGLVTHSPGAGLAQAASTSDPTQSDRKVTSLKIHTQAYHHTNTAHHKVTDRQGVVTYILTIEAFVIDLIVEYYSWLLDHSLLKLLVTWFTGDQRTKTKPCLLSIWEKFVDPLILVTQSSSWSVYQLLQRMFIAWFCFDPCSKRFYSKTQVTTSWSGTTYLPSSFFSSAATGVREYLSLWSPSGRPRWLMSTTDFAPWSRTCLMVGRAATILQNMQFQLQHARRRSSHLLSHSPLVAGDGFSIEWYIEIHTAYVSNSYKIHWKLCAAIHVWSQDGKSCSKWG